MPLTGEVNGYGRFIHTHKDGMHCIYANFDCPGLSELRNDLVRYPVDQGCNVTMDHGFTPHITLAYVPATSGEFKITGADPVPYVVDVLGGWVGVTSTVGWKFGGSPDFTPPENMYEGDSVMKIDGVAIDLVKHCGVCPEDDEYFGAPIKSRVTIEMPHQGANERHRSDRRRRRVQPRPARCPAKRKASKSGSAGTCTGAPKRTTCLTANLRQTKTTTLYL